MRTRYPLTQQDYRIEISPRAWQQIGTLPGDGFNRIQRGLEEVALRDKQRVAGALGARRLRVLEVDGYFALYEVNEEARLMTLLEVAREARGEWAAKADEEGGPSGTPQRKARE